MAPALAVRDQLGWHGGKPGLSWTWSNGSKKGLRLFQPLPVLRRQRAQHVLHAPLNQCMRQSGGHAAGGEGQGRYDVRSTAGAQYCSLGNESCPRCETALRFKKQAQQSVQHAATPLPVPHPTRGAKLPAAALGRSPPAMPARLQQASSCKVSRASCATASNVLKEVPSRGR